MDEKRMVGQKSGGIDGCLSRTVWSSSRKKMRRDRKIVEDFIPKSGSIINLQVNAIDRVIYRDA